jgi:hypothetical protein
MKAVTAPSAAKPGPVTRIAAAWLICARCYYRTFNNSRDHTS